MLGCLVGMIGVRGKTLPSIYLGSGGHKKTWITRDVWQSTHLAMLEIVSGKGENHD